MGNHKVKGTSVAGVAVRVGKGSVYQDLGYPDADQMLVKAKLVTRIADIIKAEGMTQVQAAERLSITQPMLSNILRGQFRGMSERRLMDCLTRLGKDVQIVVREAPKSRGIGQVSVVFA